MGTVGKEWEKSGQRIGIELEHSGKRVGTVLGDKRIKDRRIAIITGVHYHFFLTFLHRISH